MTVVFAARLGRALPMSVQAPALPRPVAGETTNGLHVARAGNTPSELDGHCGERTRFRRRADSSTGEVPSRWAGRSEAV
jgi:hypothetical protein